LRRKVEAGDVVGCEILGYNNVRVLGYACKSVAVIWRCHRRSLGTKRQAAIDEWLDVYAACNHEPSRYGLHCDRERLVDYWRSGEKPGPT
jgi:hypothetical protein